MRSTLAKAVEISNFGFITYNCTVNLLLIDRVPALFYVTFREKNNSTGQTLPLRKEW